MWHGDWFSQRMIDFHSEPSFARLAMHTESDPKPLQALWTHSFPITGAGLCTLPNWPVLLLQKPTRHMLTPGPLHKSAAPNPFYQRPKSPPPSSLSSFLSPGLCSDVMKAIWDTSLHFTLLSHHALLLLCLADLTQYSMGLLLCWLPVCLMCC